jgi:hypothetical protein
MKKLFLFVILLFVFCSVNVYAKSKSIIFFADSINSISEKTMSKILASKEFKIVAKISPNQPLSSNIESLIDSGKLEPVLELSSEEPYLPLLSEEIFADNLISFNRTKDLNNLLETYKQKYNDLFKGNNYGLFLTGGILNENTLKIFYANDFVWTTAKAENTKVSGAFYDEGIILFVLSKNFPLAEKQISNWLAQNKRKIMPVLLTEKHLKNDKLMAYIINLFENSKYTDVILPADVVNKTAQLEKVVLYKDKYIPKDILIKIAKAADEVDSQEDSQMYETIFSEFSNMYSYIMITRLIKKDEMAKKLFDITYKNIFKISGEDVPEVTKHPIVIENNEQENTESTFVRTDKGYKLNSTGMIKSFEIRTNDGYVDFFINSNSELENFDIYIDMNGIIDTGEHKLLKPLDGFVVSENSWEYAIRVREKNIEIYKYLIDSPSLVRKLVKAENKVRIPRSVLRGNPFNWSYQVVVVKDDAVVDFLANNKEREKFLNTTPLQLKLFKCNE